MTKGNSLYKATTLKLKKNTSKNLTVVSKNVFASSPAGAKAFNDSQKSKLSYKSLFFFNLEFVFFK